MHIPLKTIFAAACLTAGGYIAYQSPPPQFQVLLPPAAIAAEQPRSTKSTCDCATTGKCTCATAAACACKDCPTHHPKAKAKSRHYTGKDGRIYFIDAKGNYFRQDCHGTYCELVPVSPPGTKGAAPTPAYARSTCANGGCSSCGTSRSQRFGR